MFLTLCGLKGTVASTAEYPHREHCMLLRWCAGSTTSGRRFSKQIRHADQRGRHGVIVAFTPTPHTY